ncbi:MAG: ytrA 1 [Planctomycetaceae bacterium]|nr:ytrA 1 [Planctomycetaceae bacterium]
MTQRVISAPPHLRSPQGLDSITALHYYLNADMHNLSLQFEVQPSSGVPIYRQVMDQVRALVAGEKLKPGDVLPSIRQVAAALEVNMMTISKAYARLEADGVLEHVRGSGMRVAEQSGQRTIAQRQQELLPLAEALVKRGLQCNLTDEQILAVVNAALKEHRS